LLLAFTAAATADELLKIATNAGPVAQLVSFAATRARDKGLDVKIGAHVSRSLTCSSDGAKSTLRTQFSCGSAASIMLFFHRKFRSITHHF
jgi:hypothetical protein